MTTDPTDPATPWPWYLAALTPSVQSAMSALLDVRAMVERVEDPAADLDESAMDAWRGALDAATAELSRIVPTDGLTELGRRWRSVGAELQRLAPDRWPGIVKGAVDIAKRKAPAGAPPPEADLMGQWLAAARVEATAPDLFAAMVASAEGLPRRKDCPTMITADALTPSAPAADLDLDDETPAPVPPVAADVPPCLAEIAERIRGVLAAVEAISLDLHAVALRGVNFSDVGDELTRWFDGVELAKVELGRLIAGPAAAAADERDAFASLAKHAPHTYRAIAALASRLTSGAGNDLRFSDHPSPRPMTTELRIG
jgi:hypothetical protein